MTSHETKLPSASEMMDALQGVRDRARVQAHLLSLDAKKRWQELEASLLGLQSKLEVGGHDAAANATAKYRELARAAKDLLHELDGSLDLSAPVRSLMNRDVKSCSAADSLQRAAQLMWDFDCGLVFVLDSDQQVVGTITDRDACMAAYTRGQALSAIGVESAMHGQVHGCAPDDSLGDAIRLMADKQVRRLPVLDSGKLVGIITLADIARSVFEHSGKSMSARVAVAQTLAEICENRGVRKASC